MSLSRRICHTLITFRTVCAYALVVATLTACERPVRRAEIPSRWLSSPNFDERNASLVVIHYTGSSSTVAATSTLTSRGTRVSAHYLIDKKGTIIQMIDEQARAWHAGNSSWRGLTDVNSASIGVELDNDGQAPYPAVQIDALLRLLEDLRVRHRLPATAFAGHSDIAPGRKLDPGPAFPWQILAKQGFGIWCDFPKESPPVGFDPIFGLAAIGYNVREPQAAINAFRVRFKRDTRSKFLNKSDLAMIYCLAKESILR